MDKLAVSLACAVINADHQHIGQGDINIKGTADKKTGNYYQLFIYQPNHFQSNIKLTFSIKN